MSILKKDTLPFGLLVGVLFPFVVGAICFLINYIITQQTGKTVFSFSGVVMLAIMVNLFPFMKYTSSWECDNTGKGILIVTKVLVIIYVILKWTSFSIGSYSF